MLRRAIGVVLSVLLVPVVAIASGLTPFATRAAHAEGFNFLCQEPGGGGGGDSEFSLLATGLATKIILDQALWFAQITVPAGVPVTAPGAVTDPVTHATTFVMLIAPKLGNSQKLDFIPDNYPGGAGDEIRFGYAFRNKAGQRADDLSMKEMFTENFGVPLSGGDVNVAGVDIDIQTNAAIGNMQGFDATFAALYSYQLANGSTNFAAGRFNINSNRPGARIPEEATLSLAQAKPSGSTASYVAFGQRAIQAEYTGSANQQGVGFGVALDREIPGSQFGEFTADPFLSMALDWSAAPRGVAVGIGSLCPDKAQIAWNHTGMPNPAAASVGLDVKYGIEEGQQIQLPGPVDKHADITDAQGTINGLPSQMDVILMRDALSFTRSNDAAPDIDLTRLSMSDDDPAHPGNLPLFATAHATHIPRHILVTAEENPTTGAFTRADLTSWTLNCPGEPVPPGGAAPDALRRLDLPGTLPSFPVGCVRWNLTPIPSIQVVVQNWLPEDVRGQDAAAGLATAPLSANQFAFFATRSHHALSSEALRAFGAKVNGVKRATVDMTAPPAGGTGVRLYFERGGVTAADDSMQLVGDVDLRDSASDALNTGMRVSSSATITDLPDTMRIDYANTPTTPFRFTWRAAAGIALTNGVFDVLLPAPTALVVHGAFETGAVGAGALPPAADLLLAVSADQTTRSFLWLKPGAPSDTFPTPVVPAFDPNTITRMHAGAEISTLAQRNAGLAIRAHADINVPQPVTVSWVTKPDGTISSATGTFCDPAQPAGCAATKLDATAANGPRGDLSPTALLTAPALPGPDGTIQNTVPAFTDFRPDSGARAVVFSPTSWGVDLLVHGIARVAYNQSPQNVEIQMANTAPQPFRVQALDASQIVHASNGFDRPQVLFADALIDKLPQQIRVSLNDGGSDQPMVWVNTENLGITDVNGVNFDTTDAPGTRPSISGVVRAGDAQILALGVNAGNRPTPPRTAAHKGIDLFGGFDVDRGFFGIDASFALDLPRHVAIWRPTTTDCSENEDPPVALDVCKNQNKRSYEIDRTHTIDLKFRTTSQSLGDMVINGHLGGTNLNDDIHAGIGNVPGQLTGSVLIAQNARLPWTTLNASITGNAPLQNISVQVFDKQNPVSYENGDATQPTSNFGLELTNVPKQLAVNTRVLGVEKRTTDAPPPPPDCSQPPDVGAELGYVHGQLDLAGTNTEGKAELEVDVRRLDGQTVAKMLSNKPVSGFVNARVDHVTIAVDSECHATTDQRILAGAAGIGIAGVSALAGLGIGAAIGSSGGPIGAAIGAVVGLLVAFILDLFSDPTVTAKFTVDTDLPLFVGFDQVTKLAVGQNSLTLSAEQSHPNGGDPLQVGFRQQSLAGEDFFSADGAFFRSRHASYVGDDIPAQSDWDIHNDIGKDGAPPEIATVGLYDFDLCKDADTDNPCYEPGHDNVVTIDGATGAFVMDPFFSPANRSELKDNEGGSSVSPGTELFKRISDGGDPIAGADFDFSDLSNTDARSATFTLESNCCADARVPVNGTIVDLGNRGAVCEYPGPGDPMFEQSSVALGSDGTEYVVAAGGTTDAVTNDQQRSLCSNTSFVLSAHLPRVALSRLGPIRWSVSLPTPAGLEGNGDCLEGNVRCEFTYTVAPQADGSVQVTETTSVVTNGVDDSSLVYTLGPKLSELGINLYRDCCGAPDIQTGDEPTDGGSTHAMVDASGEPGFWQSDDAAVDDFSATTSGIAPVADSPGKFTLDPCAIASFACGPLEAGKHLVVLYGDGGRTEVPDGTPAVQTHVYPTFSTPQQYFGEVLLLGPNCSNDASRKCNLDQKAYFKLTN